jgi:hypothetical protein
MHGFPTNSVVTTSGSTVTNPTAITVHVRFPGNVPAGTFRIKAVGVAGGETEVAYAYLVLRPRVPTLPAQAGAPFSIAGTALNTVSPGGASRINLAITNPANTTLSVNSLRVTIKGTSAPGCAASNFTLAQYRGPYPLRIPARSTRTLQQLRVSMPSWPTLTMLDLPVNQDACKHTTVALAYAGTGSGQ